MDPKDLKSLTCQDCGRLAGYDLTDPAGPPLCPDCKNKRRVIALHCEGIHLTEAEAALFYDLYRTGAGVIRLGFGYKPLKPIESFTNALFMSLKSKGLTIATGGAFDTGERRGLRMIHKLKLKPIEDKYNDY